MLVHLGELSSARQALEGAEVAPRSEETLSMLSDPSKRPPTLRGLLLSTRTNLGRICDLPREEPQQAHQA